MTRHDPVLERLRTADPSPIDSAEPTTLISDGALRALIEDRRQSSRHEGALETPGTAHRGPRWSWGIGTPSVSAARTVAISTTVVLAVGLLISIISLRGPLGPTFEAASRTDPPADPAGDFLVGWTTEDHEDALSHLDDNALVNGEAWTLTEWRNYLEYSQAIGFAVDASCSPGPGTMTCETERTELLLDDTVVDKDTMVFGVTDDRVHAVSMQVTGTASDRVAAFAKDLDPSAYDAACSETEGSQWHVGPSGVGIALNVRCGAHMARASAAYLDALEAVRTVDAFFTAWSAGDLDDASRYLQPNVRVNGIADSEAWKRFMAFSVQFDGSHEVVCRPTARGASCSWRWRTPFVEGQATPNTGARDVVFRLEDGLIESFQTPNYGLFEAPLVQFVRDANETAFEAACASDGVSIVGTSGAVFNAACGAHLALAVDEFLASLEE